MDISVNKAISALPYYRSKGTSCNKAIPILVAIVSVLWVVLLPLWTISEAEQHIIRSLYEIKQTYLQYVLHSYSDIAVDMRLKYIKNPCVAHTYNPTKHHLLNSRQTLSKNGEVIRSLGQVNAQYATYGSLASYDTGRSRMPLRTTI